MARARKSKPKRSKACARPTPQITNSIEQPQNVLSTPPAPLLSVPQVDGEPAEAAIAKTILRPTVQGALAQRNLMREDFPDVELNRLVAELQSQAAKTASGKLGRMEAMLTTQAHTLDLLFNQLTRRAVNVLRLGHASTSETYLKLALRAQSQCRATAEAMHEMKHPRPVFVQQANFAQGHQQVNNGQFSDQYVRVRAPVGESGIGPNKLLEETDGERLGQNTQAGAATADSDLAAVGAVNRAQNGGG